jgi:hypothetical protein
MIGPTMRCDAKIPRKDRDEDPSVTEIGHIFELQISPLRFAPVEMTIHLGNAMFTFQGDNSSWKRYVPFPRRIVVSTEAQRSGEICGSAFSVTCF